MKKSAEQIADEVIEKVAMPFRKMIKDLTKHIAKQKTVADVPKESLKNLQKILKDIKKDQIAFEKEMGGNWDDMMELGRKKTQHLNMSNPYK